MKYVPTMKTIDKTVTEVRHTREDKPNESILRETSDFVWDEMGRKPRQHEETMASINSHINFMMNDFDYDLDALTSL